MENTQLSFEQILNATVRMLRTTWKVKVCLFFQLDDQKQLRIRATDGLAAKDTAQLTVDFAKGPFSACFARNKIIEVDSMDKLGALSALLKKQTKPGEKFALVP